MTSHRVLMDLVLAHRKMGFSGIPQDSRFLFARLSRSQNVTVDGLIWSDDGAWTGGKLNSLKNQSEFLGLHLRKSKSPSAVQFVARSLYRFLGGEVRTAVMRPELFDIIWRELFASSIEAAQKNILEQQKYMIWQAGLRSVSNSALSKRRGVPLDGKDYDFILFQDARNIRVTGGAQKIIRYHDGIPVLASDTFESAWSLRLHFNNVKSCEQDSLFVCNSPSSMSDLAIISAKAAERAEVIPYFIPSASREKASSRILEDIASSRISESTAGKLTSAGKQDLVDKWFGTKDTGPTIPKFIMTLSTIEPRKNIKTLITAWQKLREHDPDLRLLVVGKPGWLFEDTLRAMRPFVERGLILHLEGVAQTELGHLYSAATCFVSPSVAEGFGLPPVEAMQCGCPVVVSDIPAHRYMAGEAALFFDPYDYNDMADKIITALQPAKASELIEKGLKNCQRYTFESVLAQWEAFFDKHRSPRKKH